MNGNGGIDGRLKRAERDLAELELWTKAERWAPRTGCTAQELVSETHAVARLVEALGWAGAVERLAQEVGCSPGELEAWAAELQAEAEAPPG